MNETVNSWLGKSREERDDIYRNAKPGEIPPGDTQGTAILAGSVFARCVAFWAGVYDWQGKKFDLFCPGGHAGVLVNKITPFSLPFIVAKVYLVPVGWIKKKPSSSIIRAPRSLP